MNLFLCLNLKKPGKLRIVKKVDAAIDFGWKLEQSNFLRVRRHTSHMRCLLHPWFLT